MLRSLGWFGPPNLDRPALRRRARAVWLVSWPLLAVVAAVTAAAVLVAPETAARRAGTVAAVGTLVFVTHAISRAGRPVISSWLLVIGLVVIVTQRAWITGGIHAPVPVFYAIFIVMAGVLIGPRGGYVTAGACVAGALVLTAGTALRWLTPPPAAGPPLGAFVFVLFAVGLALVLQALVTWRPRRDVSGADQMQMIVHDMRSPLQTMLAHLELLREDVRGESLKDVEGAIDGVVTLSRMTTSLLDVGRLEAGEMPVQRAVTDLSTLAESVVRAVRVLQPGRAMIVQTRGDAVCNCDPELTRRVIENLVTNAMKHTRVDADVRVVIDGRFDTVSLAVHDEGPGVTVENRTAIFEPYSAEGLSSANGHASSGLGLTFCRLAVEAQGGTIRVEDAPLGSVFTVELPR